MFVNAYICLGANLGNVEATFREARAKIAALPACQLVAASSIWLTEPWGLRNQPWFSNQVLNVAAPEEIGGAQFLKALLAIEASLGRTRTGPRFGPRVIDIDLLLFGDQQSSDSFCQLPHPALVERAFALVPLLELAPEIMIAGRKASAWLGDLIYETVGNRIWQPDGKAANIRQPAVFHERK